MKKVINGKVYNTETAEEVHAWDNGLGYSDFRNCSETLYVTKKGNFFLEGEGGPMTRWATSYGGGNSYGSGSGLKEMSMDEVIEWLENHDGDDVLTENPLFKDSLVEA